MWNVGTSTQKMYLFLVNKALTDEKTFTRFKANPLYKGVIGCPSIHQAIGFYGLLRKDVDLLNKLDDFSRMDTIGTPERYSIGYKILSLNCLRYANSVQLLKKEFGSLDGKTVFEFGVGFGGLSHCIQSVWKTDYYIYDLEPVMDLAVKHSANLSKVVKKGIPDRPDLFIAEYSLTELGEDLYWFTDIHLMHSKNIFIRCNLVDKNEKTKWLKYLETRYQITTYLEEPNAVETNCIVIGKEK